jgi:hypothetical protein
VYILQEQLFCSANIDLSAVILLDHTLVHFEIPANNLEKMKKFYRDLFGWKIEKLPGPTDYWSIQTVPVDKKGISIRSGVNGGMMKRQNPEGKPINYVSV